MNKRKNLIKKKINQKTNQNPWKNYKIKDRLTITVLRSKRAFNPFLKDKNITHLPKKKLCFSSRAGEVCRRLTEAEQSMEAVNN